MNEISRNSLRHRLHHYALLMRLDRPIGIYLLLWPTLWALWIAGIGNPDTKVFIVFVLGVILMRSAGCIINDFADRDFDPHVQRTRNRPLAIGAVKPKEALILFVVLCLVAFNLVLLLNDLTVLLSFGGAALASLYPFTKRFFPMPQLFLGMAFGWAVPMAFAAQTGTIPMEAWLLFLATLLWTVAYDTMYAMVDREDDLRIGVKSSAILFGRADKIIIAIMQAGFFGLMIVVGLRLQLGLAYYIGLGTAALLAGYQHFLIHERHPPSCFRAFLNNNWFGAVIFIGLALNYPLHRYIQILIDSL